MAKTVLITGGAGYIGSHAAYALAQRGHTVIVLDKFVYDQSFDHPWAHVIRGDCGDAFVLDQIFSQHRVDAVMHFAAWIVVTESVVAPAQYYENNVVNTLVLLNAMKKHAVRDLIFSSTAATYGIPQSCPLTELHHTVPINPYGHTKLVVEYMIRDFAQAYGLRFVIFRYFNAAGAHPDYNLFESCCMGAGTHAIPVAIRAAMADTPFTIFGSDYQTPDGTGIRDYVHVDDIAYAHVLGFQYLSAGGLSGIFNLGGGRGCSVADIVTAVQQTVGKRMNVLYGPRRSGDPERLVADITKAHVELGWRPVQSDLETIVQTAYIAECKRRDFFRARDLHVRQACLR